VAYSRAGFVLAPFSSARLLNGSFRKSWLKGIFQNARSDYAFPCSGFVISRLLAFSFLTGKPLLLKGPGGDSGRSGVAQAVVKGCGGA